jgi:enamine deaminase RidA (YjgF/YER057c/UK114 family)
VADSELGLPVPPKPAASYVAARRHGTLLFTAGQLPFVDGRLPVTGRLGDRVDTATGQELARLAALNALAVAHAELGSLRTVSVVQLTVFVASTPEFTSQHLSPTGPVTPSSRHWGHGESTHVRRWPRLSCPWTVPWRYRWCSPPTVDLSER